MLGFAEVSTLIRRCPTSARPVTLATQITHQAIPDCLAEAVLTGAAPVPAAAAASAEMLRLTPDLQDEFIPFAWERYTDLARLGDPALVRQLRPGSSPSTATPTAPTTTTRKPATGPASPAAPPTPAAR